jgi:DNA invertase Pin-like site-specific DNA recombinase
MKYITYFRVSTQRQGQSGLGMEAQQAAVDSYLLSTGGVVVGTYQDIESGKSDKRTGLANALRRCRLTGATLLIAKLDRLSRNKAFLFAMMESKAKFVCADMPEANEMTLGFMALIADYEGKAISTRTKAALAAAKARGVKLGNTANLTNTDTTAAVKANQTRAQARNAEIYQVITELEQEHGKQSLAGMAGLLNCAGYTTARNGLWSAAQVLRVIRSAEQLETTTDQLRAA